MIVTKHNIKYTDTNNTPIIEAVQGDTGRTLLFVLGDYRLTEGTTARYYIMKPSGESVYNDATVEVATNTITVELTAQSLAEIGDSHLQVRLTKSEQVITSFEAVLRVVAFRGIGAVESSTEANIFDRQVEEAFDEIDTHKADALEEIDTEIDTHVANGKFPDMAAGDIISDLYAENKTPYFFRTSGGGAEVGTIEAHVLVGGSIGYNQLVTARTDSITSNGITFTPNGDGSYTASGTATGTALFGFRNANINVITGHKYLLTGCASGGSSSSYMLTFRDYSISHIFGDAYGSGTIVSADQSTTNGLSVTIRILSGTTINAKFVPQLADLTLLLGSTIADRLYTLEQSTAGSGIAQLKAWGFDFGKYVPYSAPTLKHVEGVSAHKFVGFNQWDEEWEVGAFNTTTGANITSATTIRAKNLIRVAPNTEYYFKNPTTAWMLTYDGDGNVITGGYVTSSHDGNASSILNRTFTTPSNCHYIRFYVTSAYGNTYKNDICINISNSAKNGTYEPYRTWSYALDSNLTLRGMPKLDANNQLYYDGDTYEPDGTVTRRFRLETYVGATSEAWGQETFQGVNAFYLNLGGNVFPDSKWDGNKVYIISNRFVGSTYNDSSHRAVGQILATGSGQYIEVLTDVANSVSAWKTWLASNPLEVLYELVEPTTETAIPFTQYQEVDANGTEEYVSTGVVPVGHVTKYPTDLKGAFESILSAIPSANGTYALKVTVNNGKHTFSWV